MTTELILRQTNASGRLLPAVLSDALARLVATSRVRPPSPRGTMCGQELRLARELAPNDPACPAFLLDFAGQGARVRGKAHGPSTVLLTWALHALAASLKCTLIDASSSVEIEAVPEAHRERALAYLSDYEADVRAARKRGDVDGRTLLAWLAREEHVALDESDEEHLSAFAAELPLQDASALYEMLLESDVVDDVFVSERELASLLVRFLARAAGED